MVPLPLPGLAVALALMLLLAGACGPSNTLPATPQTDAPKSAGCVALEVERDVFKRGEPVAFRLVNNCAEAVALPSTAPWAVRDSAGTVVFSPVGLQVIISIEPGDHREWAWDQRDFGREPVEPGMYHITVETLNKGLLTTTVKIVDYAVPLA